MPALGFRLLTQLIKLSYIYTKVMHIYIYTHYFAFITFVNKVFYPTHIQIALYSMPLNSKLQWMHKEQQAISRLKERHHVLSHSLS